MRLFPTVANIICYVCEMMRTQVSDRNYVSELLIMMNLLIIAVHL